MKEDRDLCPCALVLEFPREDADRLQDGVTVCMRGYSDDVFSLCDTLLSGQAASDGSPDTISDKGSYSLCRDKFLPIYFYNNHQDKCHQM